MLDLLARIVGISLMTLHNLFPRGMVDYFYLRSKSLQCLFNQGFHFERPNSIALAHHLGLDVQSITHTTDDGYILQVFRIQ